jgi:DNA modification methylase
MREIPDKSIDLVITDPPYGIGIANNPIRQMHEKKDWDSEIPSDDYFKEIFRISKNQIIWGGNFFDLPPSQGFLIWDKEQPEDFTTSMCEYAWSSIQSPAKMFRYRVVDGILKVHPTQKPVKLFEWIIKNYSKEGDTICDPFFGSGSCIVAAVRTGHQYIGFEKEQSYFDKANIRILNAQEQDKLSDWFK